jgi:hypothetical protein
MKEDRFSVISESKFERLSNKDLLQVKGGLCIRCRKRARKPITFEVIFGTGPKPSKPVGEIHL